MKGRSSATSGARFTGVVDRRHGCFELAHKGKLFLDEVAEMAPSLQVKVLRVSQERTVRRVGGSREQPIDVRIIAATNVNPQAAIRDGQLRGDLCYRINVITIALPSLRRRREDIPLLVHHVSDRVQRPATDGVWRAWRLPLCWPWNAMRGPATYASYAMWSSARSF